MLRLPGTLGYQEKKIPQFEALEQSHPSHQSLHTPPIFAWLYQSKRIKIYKK
jgi:hypothetical protein